MTMMQERDLYSFGYNYTLKNKRVDILRPYDRMIFAIDNGRNAVMGFRLIMI